MGKHEITPDNPAEHVDLLPSADVQPSSPSSLTTAVTQLEKHPLPPKLAAAMTTADELGIIVNETMFRTNRPQVGFTRLPWPLATRDPDHEGQAIWWYAAAIAGPDGDNEHTSIYLEGMRGPNVRALAKALAFSGPGRPNSSVPSEDEGKPQPAVDREDGKGARAAGATAAASAERGLTKLVPDDCSIVFRQMVAGEAIGSWSFRDLAKYLLLSQWGAKTHPEYLRLMKGAHGWEDTKAEGLYPGGGLY